MKLFRFGERGDERVGVLDTRGIHRDASAVLGDAARRNPVLAAPELKGIDLERLPVIPSDARIGACLARPGTFVGIGLNYRDHAREVGLAIPSEPVVFLKASSSACGPFDDVELLGERAALDYEVELGVVIGERCRTVDVLAAERRIAGYCTVIDFSDRYAQLERGGQWTKGKSADTYGPIGPYFTTRDAIADVRDMSIHLRVDDELRQSGSTRDMIWGPAELVAYVSQFMTLEPGDLVTTGTPAGVGHSRTPPSYLRAGSIVECGIDGLGVQRHRVRAR